ncbi:hypothetical protein J6590_024152 [Homalodisca vitripennis]|nr:hypothetical protein J6590_024152 [Homalodisca vitripennis]
MRAPPSPPPPPLNQSKSEHFIRRSFRTSKACTHPTHLTLTKAVVICVRHAGKTCGIGQFADEVEATGREISSLLSNLSNFLERLEKVQVQPPSSSINIYAAGAAGSRMLPQQLIIRRSLHQACQLDADVHAYVSIRTRALTS